MHTSADVLMGTDSTDAEGNYSVGSLPTGEYKVSFGGNANHLAGGTVTGISVTIPDATDVRHDPDRGLRRGLRYGHRHRRRSPGHPRHRGHRAHLADVLMGTDSTDAKATTPWAACPPVNTRSASGATPTTWPAAPSPVWP